jgi:hypothetical protein
MATQQALYFCEQCQKTTLHLEKRTNHVLHLLLSLATLGAWIIVWALVAAGTSNPQCTVCGARAKYRTFRGYRREA